MIAARDDQGRVGQRAGGEQGAGEANVAVPQNRQAGAMSTTGTSAVAIPIATAPPRLLPTTTSGRLASNASWAIRTEAAKSSSGSPGLSTSWPRAFR